jgi:hypothetical protein
MIHTIRPHILLETRQWVNEKNYEQKTPQNVAMYTIGNDDRLFEMLNGWFFNLTSKPKFTVSILSSPSKIKIHKK